MTAVRMHVDNCSSRCEEQIVVCSCVVPSEHCTPCYELFELIDGGVTIGTGDIRLGFDPVECCSAFLSLAASRGKEYCSVSLVYL